MQCALSMRAASTLRGKAVSCPIH